MSQFVNSSFYLELAGSEFNQCLCSLAFKEDFFNEKFKSSVRNVIFVANPIHCIHIHI